jgi:hypothetical protein
MENTDFLDLAIWLKELPDAKEVEFRSSISRSFTYLYNFLKEKFHHDLRITFKKDDMDKRLLKDIFNQAGEYSLLKKWVLFCKDRNDAEYDITAEEFIKEDADEYIEDLEAFIEEVKPMKVKKVGV